MTNIVYSLPLSSPFMYDSYGGNRSHMAEMNSKKKRFSYRLY